MNKNFAKELAAFLDASPSNYHAAEQVKSMLLSRGYTQLLEGDAWEIMPGGKYFVLRNGSALMAFRAP